ncbi:MAG TPA: hypothetical protein VGM18_21490 [Candidatus Sulfotelmatobacter sp.]|jgi:hypothetical protein
MAKRRIPLLKLRIDGPGVRRGAISVPDLIRICQAAQDAVNRQAEAMRGGQSLRPGRKSAVVYQECTLELTGIQKGSTILPFSLAKPQQSLPLPDLTTFGRDVVLEVAHAVKEIGSDGRRRRNPHFEAGLLYSLREMGEVLDKDVTSIEWIVPGNGHRAVKAVFDKRVRDRVIERIQLPSTRPEEIEGVLEMADFKEQDHKCRIHPLLGQPIVCTFKPEQEEDVYAALRKPVKVFGTATINPNSGKVESIAIEKIGVVEQLLIGARDFHAGRSMEQLAEAQGVQPLDNPKVLAGGWPDNEDLDQFLEDIYSSRLS